MTLPEKSMPLLPFREASSNGTQALRVGVVVDPSHTSPWVDAMLSFLRQLSGIDVAFSPSLVGLWQHPNDLHGSRIGFTASRARFDRFGDITADRTESAIDGSMYGIRAAGCGVLVSGLHATEIPTSQGCPEAWSVAVRFGKRNRLIPFWNEAANGELISIVTI